MKRINIILNLIVVMVLFSFGSSYIIAQISEKLLSAIEVSVSEPFRIIKPSFSNEIDIDDVIRIRFNPDKISDAITLQTENNDKQLLEYNEKIKSLGRLLEVLNLFSDKGRNMLNMDPNEWKEYAETGLAFIEELEKSLENIPNKEIVLKKFDDQIGSPGGINEAIKYLCGVIRDELKKLNKHKPDLSSDEKIAFQITAQLIYEGGSRWLNIPGYYDAKTDNPSKYQKIKYSFSEEETAVIQNQAELINTLAKAKSNFEAIKTLFKGELDKIIDSYKDLKTKIEGISINQLNKFSELIIKNDSVMKNIIQPSRELIIKTQELLELLKNKHEKFSKDARDILNSNNQSAAKAMFSILNTASIVVDDINDVSLRIKKIGGVSNTVLEGISKVNLDEINKMIKNENADIELNTIKIIIADIQTISSKFENIPAIQFWNTIKDKPKSKETIEQSITASMDMTPDLVDKIQKHTQDDLMETQIYLEEYKERKPGSYVKIRILVTKEFPLASSKQQTILLDCPYLIKLGAFKWSSDLYTGLVFVNKPNDNGEYYPTFAVSWMLKYLALPGTACREFWNSFGIGFHAITLVVDQGKTQIGFGPSIHFLNNIIQAGYGWNFGARGIPYYYVGIGLIDLLNKVK